MTNKTVIDFRNDPLVTGSFAIVAYARRKNGNRPAMDYIENLEKLDKIYPKVRVLCFQLEKTWLLTHGFDKETGDTPPRQIERAEVIMKEHISLLSQ